MQLSVIEASFYNDKTAKQKLLKMNAAIWFNKILVCITKQLTSNVLQEILPTVAFEILV
jgi:hypothetical protein